jgi:hypothetical protein
MGIHVTGWCEGTVEAHNSKTTIDVADNVYQFMVCVQEQGIL